MASSARVGLARLSVGLAHAHARAAAGAVVVVAVEAVTRRDAAADEQAAPRPALNGLAHRIFGALRQAALVVAGRRTVATARADVTFVRLAVFVARARVA